MAKKQQTQALATWNEDLAKMAAEYADQEANTGGGQFVSTRGGVLSFGDQPFPNNEMAAIIVDSILTNVYYEGDYDPETPQTPSCYAFGRDEKTLAPHDDAEVKQADGCEACPQNVFGSALKGRGKACTNRRRLGLISAGDLDPKTGEFTAVTEEAQLAKAQVAYLMLSPMSLNAFGSYVKELKAKLNRPPFAVFTKVSLVPDPKAQFKVVYECLGPVPDELLSACFARNKEVREVIAFPFPKREAEAAPAKPQRGQRVQPQRTAARQQAPRRQPSGGKF